MDYSIRRAALTTLPSANRRVFMDDILRIISTRSAALRDGSIAYKGNSRQIESIRSTVLNRRITEAEENDKDQLQVIHHVLKDMQMATNKKTPGWTLKMVCIYSKKF